MKKQILIIILLLLNSVVALVPVDGNAVQVDNVVEDDMKPVASGSYPSGIGYEFLNDGDILHIWNTNDNYYFDVNSGIQLTNHYMQYWTHNVMMLGYCAGDDWNLIYRTDELSGFSKTIDTDGSTYINITMWKDLSYSGYDFRLAIVYYLELNDENLTVIPYIKNLGVEIPFVLAFGWELKDIQIDMTVEYDQIYINNITSYMLNQALDESYTGSDTDGVFYLQNNISGNINKDLYLKWDSSLTYLLTVKSRVGQYNAPVTLFIRIGTLNVGQEKFTKMYWHDSDTLYERYTSGEDGGTGANADIWEAQTFTIGNTGTDEEHTVTYVNLRVYKEGSPGTVTVSIRATAGGAPTGSDLCSVGQSVPYGTNWVTFTFASPTLLSASTKYAIVTRAPDGDGSNYVSWREDRTSPTYTGGSSFESSDSGSSWSAQATKDFLFQEYGNVPPNQTGESPTNGSNGIGFLPSLYVTCTDTSDTMDAMWYSNSSNSWVQFASNGTIANNTNITQSFTNATGYNTKYWWSVNLTDGFGWINKTYHFTTINTLSLINASTGIEKINATLHGYLTNNASGSYSYGFWVGTSTPVTEINADHNITGIGTVTATGDMNFSHNDSNLSKSTHYYVRSWVSNATFFGPSGNEDDFWTKCDAPSGFTATLSGCNVALAWTKGTEADKTTVVRKVDAYPANQTDGTVVYNNTASTYSDTTGSGSHQYYRAWSWVGDKHSDENASTNVTVPPCPPTGVDTNVLTNNTFDLLWTKGTGTVNTVVRKKLGSYPSSVTDGTEIYNDTGTQVNVQDMVMYYYSLWSYANLTYSSSVNITAGGLIVNCYDEETNDSLYFDIFISNQDGSQSYESRNNSNGLMLNISQLPTGDDIKITVSAASNYSDKSEVSYWNIDENYTITYIILSQVPDSKSSTNVTCINTSDDAHSYPPFTLDGDLITILPDDADNFTKVFVNYTHEEYSSRLYYRDISEASFGILNTYLPPTEDKELYLLEVIDEAGNTVSDAYIEVKRSVNGTFVIVSRLLTDANGQADLNLISDRNYIFIISKEGYITENASWTPGTSIFTHTFRIIWEVVPFEPDTFGDLITFYGMLYINNTMEVTFYDLKNEMIDSHFTIYESYNGTLTYMGEYNGTTSNDIIFWINVDNATRLHIIILYMNHSTLRETIDYRIFVYPVHIDREGGTWLENLIVSVVGEFDYGYVITLIWFLPCVLLVVGMASIKQPGIGILGAGLYSVWITWNITLPEEAKILTFASIAIVTGFITLFLVKGKEAIH